MSNRSRREALALLGAGAVAAELARRRPRRDRAPAQLAARRAAAHRHPRRRARARRRRLVHGAAQRPSRLVRSASGRVELIALGNGLVAARRDPGPRQGSVAHRRRPQRDRPRRLARSLGARFTLARRQRACANLNTATFDRDGDLWFTGQTGVVGKLAVKSGRSASRTRRAAPARTASARRRAATSGGARSPARSSPASIAPAAIRRSSSRRRAKQGARRVWSDSQSRIWVSEWLSGNVSMHDPAEGDLAHLAACRARRRALRRLRRRSRHGVAERLGQQRDRPLRSRQRDVRARSRTPTRPPACARSSAARARSGCRKAAPSTSACCAPPEPARRRAAALSAGRCASGRERSPAPPRRATSPAPGAGRRTRPPCRRSSRRAARHGRRSRRHRQARSATPAPA